jgi:hypothetical protein
MNRHSIKKRWERLGVWNPEWGIPHRVNEGPKDYGEWSWVWDQNRPRHRERDYDRVRDEVLRTSRAR